MGTKIGRTSVVRDNKCYFICLDFPHGWVEECRLTFNKLHYLTVISRAGNLCTVSRFYTGNNWHEFWLLHIASHRLQLNSSCPLQRSCILTERNWCESRVKCLERQQRKTEVVSCLTTTATRCQTLTFWARIHRCETWMCLLPRTTSLGRLKTHIPKNWHLHRFSGNLKFLGHRIAAEAPSKSHNFSLIRWLFS